MAKLSSVGRVARRRPSTPRLRPPSGGSSTSWNFRWSFSKSAWASRSADRTRASASPRTPALSTHMKCPMVVSSPPRGTSGGPRSLSRRPWTSEGRRSSRDWLAA
eukprot:7308254-Pyramimonas_sp.AAC.1